MKLLVSYILLIFFSSTLIAQPKTFLGVSYKVVALKKFSINKNIKDKYAIQILHIVPGTSAAKSELQKGDLITHIDGQEFTNKQKSKNREFFRNQILEKDIGYKMQVKILRINEEYHLQDKILGQKEWLEFTKKQDYNQNLNVLFKKYTKILNFSIKLGSNPFHSEEATIDEHIFDNYKITKKNTLLEKVFLKYNLQASSDELTAIFREDAKTNYGCRMPAISFLHTNPNKLLPIIDKVTNKFYESYQKKNIPNLLQDISNLINSSNLAIAIPSFPQNNNWQDHLQYIQTVFQLSNKLENKAFKKLSQKEKKTAKEYFDNLAQELIANFGLSQNSQLSQKSYNIRLIIQKIDFTSLLQSAWVLSHLTANNWHSYLKKAISNIPAKQYTDNDIKGKLLFLSKKDNFSIVVGSKNANNYAKDFSVIIDLGGDDYYSPKQNGSKFILDLQGNDFYSSTKSHTQAAAFLGIKLLVDKEGNDIYTAQYFAQGSAIFGVAILYDVAGDDFYKSRGLSQAYSFFGVGLLLDQKGKDEYSADIFSQGTATCGGVSLLFDAQGDDKYRAGLTYSSTYQVPGSFHGASQGLGFGVRSYFDGGIGFLLDGGGNDIFQAGNFSQASGYFFGLGVVKNFGKNQDNYISYRYGQASAAHSALGVLIDEGGNDTYRGQVGAVQSAAWDKSATAFWDKKGNDTYISLLSAFSLAAAAHNGYSYFLDSAGVDNYQITNFDTTTQNSYHGGSSLSFFFDLGKRKDYFLQDNIQNNTSWKKRTTQIFWDQ